MKLVQITQHDTALLEKFLKKAGRSLERFRYFNKRTPEVLKNHLVTIMIEDDNGEPVAYGHLDFEGGIVWLGNCVVESETGKGLGKKIMQGLLNYARDYKVERIRLSVDDINEPAKKLYESFGFREIEKKETFSFYEWMLKANPEIYISSIAFMGKPAEEIISIAQQNNYGIEFSSGMPYRAEMEETFLDAPVRKYAHNYFPAPETPFVLNLASTDDATRIASIAHCINGMQLSEEVGARFFSAHAGFCVDPKPEELGNPLSRVKKINKKENWKLFLESISEILTRTKGMNVRFLIENNVIAKMNIYENGTNPLLCCDADEMQKLIKEINDPRLGILLDTAHLKVSAQTLGFDMHIAVVSLKDFIRCLHHSDNEGVVDNNLPFNSDYWFLKHMPHFAHALHVIEVKKQTPLELDKMIRLLQESVMVPVA